MENKNSFFEPRMIVAILITLGFFIWWQNHLAEKYPAQQASNAPAKATAEAQKDQSAPQSPENQVPSLQSTAAPLGTAAEEKVLRLNLAKMSVEVSSVGMGLKSISLNNYQDRKKNPIILGSPVAPYNFQTSLLDETAALNFQLEKISETEVLGKAVRGPLTLEKRISIDPDKYTVKVRISAKSSAGGVPSLALYLTQSGSNTAEEKGFAEKVSFLSPQLDQDEVLFLHGDKKKDRSFSNSETPYVFDASEVQLAAISSLFFSSSVISQGSWFTSAEARFDAVRGHPIVRMIFKPDSGASENTLELMGFAGPKSLDNLKAIDPRMKNLVDFGFFSALADILLGIMKWFFGFVQNYGIAIILLTIVVRLVVLPANLMSYKSMAGMQKIKPEMDRIREKFKEDPARMQQETMALFKKEKINPLGGCLPAFIQLPVFVALYQVLGHSIELYKAPFGLWLHDLSAKDPYFILPIAMGGALFLQQKMTPSTMDPAQQRIMNFLPLIFTIPMLGLPSGLSLYWFTSTLFGIAQQMVFLRRFNPVNVSGKPIVAK